MGRITIILLMPAVVPVLMTACYVSGPPPRQDPPEPPSAPEPTPISSTVVVAPPSVPTRSPGEIAAQVTAADRLANDALRIEGSGSFALASDLSVTLPPEEEHMSIPGKMGYISSLKTAPLAHCAGTDFANRVAKVAEKSKVAALAGEALCITNSVVAVQRLKEVVLTPEQLAEMNAGAEKAQDLAMQAHNEAERGASDLHTQVQAEEARLDEAAASCDPAKARQAGRTSPAPGECQRRCSSDGDQASCVVWAVQILDGTSFPTEPTISLNPRPTPKFEKALPLLNDACSKGEIRASCALAQRVEGDKKQAEFDAYSKWQDAQTLGDDIVKMRGEGLRLRQLPATPSNLKAIQWNDNYVTTKLGEFCTAKKDFTSTSGTVEFTRLATEHCRWDSSLGQERSKDLATRCIAVYASACR
jgi:hypothetical protein